MWTFLGIASFTYLYKKSSTVLSYAHKELLMAAALFLTVGLLLSYVSYFHKLRVSQVLHLPLRFLSFVPVINNLIPQTLTQRTQEAENSCKKVSNCFGEKLKTRVRLSVVVSTEVIYIKYMIFIPGQIMISYSQNLIQHFHK